MSRPTSSLLQKRSTQIALGLAAAVTGGVLITRATRGVGRLTETPEANAARQVVGPDGVTKTDVLIVGSGGAALTAALRAKTLGLSTLVVEKSPKIGGTSCYSGSGCWIPNSHVHADPNDSVEKALTYMESIVGDAGPASSKERKLAFLHNGPVVVKWLETQGYKWTKTPKYPDYFPYNPGAQVGGRSIEANMFDRKLLGPWFDSLNINPVRPPLPLYTYELSKIVRVMVSMEGLWTGFKIYGTRRELNRWLGAEPVTLGVSMISQLIYLNVKQGTPIWTSTPMIELTTKDGQVTGAIVERDGKKLTVEASQGVIIAAGGFARNEAMRKEFQAPEITGHWTSACPTDQGEPIRSAMKIGAATALMDSAWWGAAMYDPESKKGIWCLYDRGLPHSLIVDREGNRFANESQNYNSLGTAIWKRQKEVPTIPAYLIMDSTHRKRYLLAGRFFPGGPNSIPQSAIDSGFIYKADTLEDLAKKLEINGEGLQATVKRFNGFVDTGVDEDFKRGSSVYDFYLGDPSYGTNRNLGKVDKGPFYAVKVYPGDLGTKGGVLTDEKARALRETKSGLEVIKGLYAIGNSSATVMGRTYAGAGSTLGPGITFGYLAANDCAEKAKA